MLGGGGVFEMPAIQGMRGVTAVDERGNSFAWYLVIEEEYDERVVDSIRARLKLHNLKHRVLKMVP
jgi:hypothetical protein